MSEKLKVEPIATFCDSLKFYTDFVFEKTFDYLIFIQESIKALFFAIFFNFISL